MYYGLPERASRKAFTTLWQYGPLPGAIDILPSYAGDDFDPSVEYFNPSQPTVQEMPTRAVRTRASVDPSVAGQSAADLYSIGQKLVGDIKGGAFRGGAGQPSTVNLPTEEKSGIPTWAWIVGGTVAAGAALWIGMSVYKASR
jgi:hypothetical protein